MTNRELARRLGVTESYVSYLRRGDRMPSAQVLSGLIADIGLDAAELMSAYRDGPQVMVTYLREQIPRVD